MAIISVDSKATREDELQKAVSAATKQAVQQSQIDGQTEIKSNQDMIEFFTNTLCLGINSKGDLSIEVMGVDYKQGMLDVLVTEKFQYINGKTGKIMARKCAIYE